MSKKSPKLPYGWAKRDEIRIGGSVWTIYMVNLNVDPDMEGCEGICRPYNAQILISTKLSSSRYHETLWHEICHAVMHVAGVSATMKVARFENRGDMEESLISIFGQALYQVIADNPKLIMVDK